MIKTESFIKSMVEKGIVDDALTLENGYDVQYKGNIVSVRLNNKGGAMIFNKKRNDLIEVSSGRLDDVLHRYIVQSIFGTQSKSGVQGVEYKDVFFVPTKVLKNSVIFEDTVGRKFTVKGSTPQAVLSFYNDMVDVNADDSMVLLSNFELYDKPEEKAINSSTAPEIELQLLRCSLNIDDYAVSPKSECINSVGQTIVGNFLVSSADKASQITFEEDEHKLFSSTGIGKKNIVSSRTKNPLAFRAKVALNSSASKKAVMSYLDSKYPDGLCVSAVEHVMAYEAPSLFKAAGVTEKLSYKDVFSGYLRKADSVSFRLDSNKSILSSLSVMGKSVSKFRSVPDVSAIKNGLHKYGYSVADLEAGLEFKATEPVVASLVNACKDYVPVVEKAMMKSNAISKISGKDCTQILSGYGINDKQGVFKEITRIIVN